MGPYHACNGPHLIKDCEELICKRYKPILDSHTLTGCLKKDSPADSKSEIPSYSNNNTRNQSIVTWQIYMHNLHALCRPITHT